MWGFKKCNKISDKCKPGVLGQKLPLYSSKLSGKAKIWEVRKLPSNLLSKTCSRWRQPRFALIWNFIEFFESSHQILTPINSVFWYHNFCKIGAPLVKKYIEKYISRCIWKLVSGSRHFGVCVILIKPSGGNYRYYFSKSIIPSMSCNNTYIRTIDYFWYIVWLWQSITCSGNNFCYFLQELYFFFVILVVPAVIMAYSYCKIVFELPRVVRQRVTMTGYPKQSHNAQASRKST